MTGCWLWAAGESHGYGVLADGRGSYDFAHRFSWEHFKGPIPEGLNVCHKCDTPLCVNPDHLFTGTQKDNCQDMASKGRHGQQTKTHCKNGHLLSGRNVYTYARRPKTRLCRACRNAHSDSYKSKKGKI